MEAIPEEKTVISLHYQGYTRDEIHAKTGISTGKISNIIAKEKKMLGAGDVDAIRRAGKELLKGGKSWEDIGDAIAFQNYCKKHGLELEKLKEDVPRVQEKCKEHGLGLEDLPLDTDNKVKANAELEAKKQVLKQEVSDIEKARAQKLKDAGETDESLAKCKEMRGFLASYGFTPDDPERLRNALSSAKESGYDDKMIADKISLTSSLNTQAKEMEKVLKHQAEKKRLNQEEIEKQDVQIMANAPLKEEGDRLKGIGATTPMLEAITAMIGRVAKANKMTDAQATEKFVTDVLTKYEPLAGFEKATGEANKKLAEVEKFIEMQRIAFGTDIKAAEALKALHSRGMANHEILGVKAVIDTAGASTIAELEEDITIYGSLKKAITGKQKTNREIDTENLALAKQNELLEVTNEALKKAGDNFQAIFSKQTQEMVDTVRGARERIGSSAAESVRAVEQAGEDMRGKVLAVANSLVGLEAHVTREREKLEKEPTLLRYLPLVRAERGEPVAKEAAVAALSLAVHSATPLLTGPHLKDARQYLEAASNKLDEAVKLWSTI